MFKMFSVFTSYMIRPTIYRTASKSIITLTLLLIWDRYLNDGRMSVMRDGAFIVGIILLGTAWWNYLRLDGIKNPFTAGKKEKKKKKNRITGDIADYADQHIVNFDELDEQEQYACGMCSSLAAALLFLVPSVVELVRWAQ